MPSTESKGLSEPVSEVKIPLPLVPVSKLADSGARADGLADGLTETEGLRLAEGDSDAEGENALISTATAW